MTKGKEQIRRKVDFLIGFAVEQASAWPENPFIKEYIGLAFDLAKKVNYRIPSEIHRKVCKNCFCLRTADNTMTRTERRKVNKVYQKYIKIHCLNCEYIKKLKINK